MPKKAAPLRSSDQQHGRPASMAYCEYVKNLNSATLDRGEYSRKYNGFSVYIQTKSDGSGLTYCSKSGNPFTEASMDAGKFIEDGMQRRAMLEPVKCLGGQKVFRAMEWYMREKVPYLDPRSVEYNGRKGMILKAEFCVYRKDCPKEYDDLAALMFGLCVTEDDKIDLDNYQVEVVVFDVVFEGYPERSDCSYHYRIECIGEAFNGFEPQLHKPFDPAVDFTDEYEPIPPDDQPLPVREYRCHTPWRLYGRSDVVEALSEHEGMVLCLGHSPFEYWVKVKPDRPVGLEIVAVLNTLGADFQGYDKILVASSDGDNCRKAVDMIDLSVVFSDYTRVKQGKAFVNPASIKRDPVSGIIDCTTSSSLRPMLSALFGRISQHGGRLITPTVISTSEVRVGDQRVKCGTKRSFHRWFRHMLFLENPVRVTMSANEFWLVPGDQTEVHLQASRVLSVGNYGPEHFQNLPPVSHATLHTIAADRLDRNPQELFRLAGVVGMVPFVDLPPMDEELFMP
jgi:hypothetical protein